MPHLLELCILSTCYYNFSKRGGNTTHSKKFAIVSMASSTIATNTSEADALKAAIFQRLHPRSYLERFLAEGFRPDGRDLEEWRTIEFNVGSISTANGSALVRLGQTTIVCGVKAEISEPDLDCEEEGFLGIAFFVFFVFLFLLSLWDPSPEHRPTCSLLTQI
jgi:hypothetical protein